MDGSVLVGGCFTLHTRTSQLVNFFVCLICCCFFRKILLNFILQKFKNYESFSFLKFNFDLVNVLVLSIEIRERRPTAILSVVVFFHRTSWKLKPNHRVQHWVGSCLSSALSCHYLLSGWIKGRSITMDLPKDLLNEFRFVPIFAECLLNSGPFQNRRLVENWKKMWRINFGALLWPST